MNKKIIFIISILLIFGSYTLLKKYYQLNGDVENIGIESDFLESYNPFIFLYTTKTKENLFSDFGCRSKNITTGQEELFKCLFRNVKFEESRFDEYKKDYINQKTIVSDVENIYKQDGGKGCGYPTQNKPELILKKRELIPALLKVSENKLTFRNFCRFFCIDCMPIVYLNSEKMNLKQLYKSINGKPIKIKKGYFEKHKNGCITKLYVNYKEFKFQLNKI